MAASASDGLEEKVNQSLLLHIFGQVLRPDDVVYERWQLGLAVFRFVKDLNGTD